MRPFYEALVKRCFPLFLRSGMSPRFNQESVKKCTFSRKEAQKTQKGASEARLNLLFLSFFRLFAARIPCSLHALRLAPDDDPFQVSLKRCGRFGFIRDSPHS